MFSVFYSMRVKAELFVIESNKECVGIPIVETQGDFAYGYVG